MRDIQTDVQGLGRLEPSKAGAHVSTKCLADRARGSPFRIGGSKHTWQAHDIRAHGAVRLSCSSTMTCSRIPEISRDQPVPDATPCRFLQRAAGSRKFVVDLPANRPGPAWRRVGLTKARQGQGDARKQLLRTAFGANGITGGDSWASSAPRPAGSDTARRSGAISRIATIPSTTKRPTKQF